MQYRRARIAGAAYFFTVVTYQRRRFLCTPDNAERLRQAFRVVMNHHPFEIDAFVLLPDHLHCIWSLPPRHRDFSMRWRLIKSHFSRACQTEGRTPLTASQTNKGERAIWQRRFWEHCLRDEEDFARHVEYIHYNPVKQGLAAAPRDWPYSSFHRYVRDGILDPEWGAHGEMQFEATIGRE